MNKDGLLQKKYIEKVCIYKDICKITLSHPSIHSFIQFYSFDEDVKSIHAENPSLLWPPDHYI